MKPLSVLTKAPLRKQNLWVWFKEGLLYKCKAKLLYWAIHWGTCWASFVTLMLFQCCDTALPLLCYGATAMRVATHHCALPLVTLLGHSCCFSATVIILCQSSCQPVSCYVTTVMLLDRVALLSRCHATLPCIPLHYSHAACCLPLLFCLASKTACQCHAILLDRYMLIWQCHTALLVTYCFTNVMLVYQ